MILIYINRGVFITPYEIENNDNKEINSVIEWIIQFITGEDNGIDEDGDLQSDCNSVTVIQHDFSQQLAQSIMLASLFHKELNSISIVKTEELPNDVYHRQIDQPPEL